MQKVKNWWNDTNLTVKLLGLLLGLMISVGGWAVSQIITVPDVYAKKANLEKIKMVTENIPIIYARKDDITAHKNKTECSVKDISTKMDQGFNRMGDKIDRNNSAVNEKIDKLMMLLMRSNHAD